MKRFYYTLIIACHSSLWALKIGFLIVATNRYIEFIPKLVEQGTQHIFPGHQVTFFIFTDMPVTPQPNVVRLYHEHLKWPYSTLFRYRAYAKYKEFYKDYDYLFACDADMEIINTIDETILGETIGTLHPGYSIPNTSAFYTETNNPLTFNPKQWHLLKGEYTYESNPSSTAFLPQGEYYFCGGFFGGKATNFINMIETLNKHIDQDLANNYIAVWHDESHLNWYYNTHKPDVILPPAYCYPDHYTYHKTLPSSFKPTVIALTKNHKEYQK